MKPDYRPALLEAILSRPDNDDYRLLYASACEEQGCSSQAEFIRCQIELARTPTCGHSWGLVAPVAKCRCCELYELEQWFTHNPEQGRPDKPWRPHQWLNYGNDHLTIGAIWRRGFVAHVRCSMEDWVEHGANIVRDHPVEGVWLVDRKPHHDQGRFWWYAGLRPIENPNYLPWEIFEFISSKACGAAAFDSVDEALHDMSRASLLLAKKRLLMVSGGSQQGRSSWPWLPETAQDDFPQGAWHD
jgi:uncharacterized protein (TIGR02996 family)